MWEAVGVKEQWAGVSGRTSFAGRTDSTQTRQAESWRTPNEDSTRDLPKVVLEGAAVLV